MAVVRSEVLVQLAQIQKLVDTTQQVVCWNVIFQVEGIEQWRLPGLLTSHHRVCFRLIDGMSVKQHQMTDSTEFFNGIDPKRTFSVSKTGAAAHFIRNFRTLCTLS